MPLALKCRVRERVSFKPLVVPEDHFSSDDEDEEREKDRRITRKFCQVSQPKEKMSDKHRVPETELSDSEDEGDNRRDQRSYKDANQMAATGNGNTDQDKNIDQATDMDVDAEDNE